MTIGQHHAVESCTWCALFSHGSSIREIAGRSHPLREELAAHLRRNGFEVRPGKRPSGRPRRKAGERA